MICGFLGSTKLAVAASCTVQREKEKEDGSDDEVTKRPLIFVTDKALLPIAVPVASKGDALLAQISFGHT
ncbi:hypothetical protein K7X08_005549 [Anisodus acutangulus]|uniref:Uncharacterized protein n=1 Tax=Anisodus acutangulus TaxID=402998 RepID=A0A9Q1LUU6_9SOLA|nr:hypothetical protein K7X08_005549 [Anisodus acutangulus]